LDDIIHIGDKTLSRRRLQATIDEMLRLRSAGFSQQATADRFAVDRSFVSRLETLAELHKGGSIGLVGFPIANRDEVRALCEQRGVDYVLLLSERERQAYLNERTGMNLLHEVLGTVARLRTLDHVVLVTSDHWFSLAAALLGREVTGLRLGPSPMTEDRTVDPHELAVLLDSLGSGRTQTGSLGMR
jgi:hypothetical protein